MELLSDAISRRTFNQTTRGYDVREVEGFMADAVERARALETDLAGAYGKLNAFERSADAGKDAGLVVQDAFRVVTARRDEIIAEAEVKAAAIVAEADSRAAAATGANPAVAQVESDMILNGAREKADQLVVAAEQRSREILRVAKAQADTEGARAMVDAREGATAA